MHRQGTKLDRIVTGVVAYECCTYPKLSHGLQERKLRIVRVESPHREIWVAFPFAASRAGKPALSHSRTLTL